VGVLEAAHQLALAQEALRRLGAHHFRAQRLQRDLCARNGRRAVDGAHRALADQRVEPVALSERLTDERLGSFFCRIAHRRDLGTSKPP